MEILPALAELPDEARRKRVLGLCAGLGPAAGIALGATLGIPALPAAASLGAAAAALVTPVGIGLAAGAVLSGAAAHMLNKKAARDYQKAKEAIVERALEARDCTDLAQDLKEREFEITEDGHYRHDPNKLYALVGTTLGDKISVVQFDLKRDPQNGTSLVAHRWDFIENGKEFLGAREVDPVQALRDAARFRQKLDDIKDINEYFIGGPELKDPHGQLLAAIFGSKMLEETATITLRGVNERGEPIREKLQFSYGNSNSQQTLNINDNVFTRHVTPEYGLTRLVDYAKSNADRDSSVGFDSKDIGKKILRYIDANIRNTQHDYGLADPHITKSSRLYELMRAMDDIHKYNSERIQEQENDKELSVSIGPVELSGKVNFLNKIPGLVITPPEKMIGDMLGAGREVMAGIRRTIAGTRGEELVENFQGPISRLRNEELREQTMQHLEATRVREVPAPQRTRPSTIGFELG